MEGGDLGLPVAAGTGQRQRAGGELGARHGVGLDERVGTLGEGERLVMFDVPGHPAYVSGRWRPALNRHTIRPTPAKGPLE
jgi:hypothetical protein